MTRAIDMQMTPLKVVEDMVRTQRADSWDEYAALTDVRVDVNDPLAPVSRRFKVRLARERRIVDARPTGHAIAQLCNLLRVPTQFLERVPAAVGLRLLRTLQDTSQLSDGRAMLMRFRGKDRPVLRAVLPSSFVRIDDLEILGKIKQAGQYKLDSLLVQFDEDTLTLQLALNERDKMLNLGIPTRKDPAMVGISIMTSETGAHPLEIRHLLLRQVCQNGLTVPLREQNAVRRRLTQTDRFAVHRAIDECLANMIPRGRELAESLADTRSQMVPDPSHEIQTIFHRHRLGNPNGRLGRWVTEEVGRQMTLFGAQRFELVQAFTSVARRLERADRLRFEDAMGAYVEEAVRGN